MIKSPEQVIPLPGFLCIWKNAQLIQETNVEIN